MSQGKYSRKILEKFHMQGCKPIDTPLPGNWKKEDATSSEVVDATIYIVGGFTHVFSQYKTGHMLCGEIAFKSDG